MSTASLSAPQPQPVTVDSKKTALLVLDLDKRCGDPKHHSYKIAPGIIKFLDKARAAGIPIIYTSFPRGKKFSGGIHPGTVYSGFHRKPSEVIVRPDSFNKFSTGDLLTLLKLYDDVDTLIITGARTNICVLYTSTEAAGILGYNVIIPVDGVIAKTDYEQEYTFVQLTVLPQGSERIKFSKLDTITFAGSQ